jgi:hypothetical protein
MLSGKRIEVQYLKSIVSYDKETGVFQRKDGVKFGFKDDGYLRSEINGKNYYLHRLAWLYEYGEFPDSHLDHVNGDKADNRIENLRKASRSENLCNVRKTKRNTSGYKNVTFHKESNKWRVKVSVNGKNKSFGLYEDIELADLVAIEVRNKFHGQFANHSLMGTV